MRRHEIDVLFLAKCLLSFAGEQNQWHCADISEDNIRHRCCSSRTHLHRSRLIDSARRRTQTDIMEYNIAQRRLVLSWRNWTAGTRRGRPAGGGHAAAASEIWPRVHDRWGPVSTSLGSPGSRLDVCQICHFYLVAFSTLKIRTIKMVSTAVATEAGLGVARRNSGDNHSSNLQSNTCCGSTSNSNNFY